MERSEGPTNQVLNIRNAEKKQRHHKKKNRTNTEIGILYEGCVGVKVTLNGLGRKKEERKE